MPLNGAVFNNWCSNFVLKYGVKIAPPEFYYPNKTIDCRGRLAQRENVCSVIIGFNRAGFDSAVCQEFLHKAGYSFTHAQHGFFEICLMYSRAI